MFNPLVQHVFVELLPRGRPCSRIQGYSSEQNRHQTCSRQHTLSISCRGKSRKEGLGSEGTPRFSRIWGVGFRKEAGPPCSMMESVGTTESHGSDEKEEVSL